jgi:hypothetical protein
MCNDYLFLAVYVESRLKPEDSQAERQLMAEMICSSADLMDLHSCPIISPI